MLMDTASWLESTCLYFLSDYKLTKINTYVQCLILIPAVTRIFLPKQILYFLQEKIEKNKQFISFI